MSDLYLQAQTGPVWPYSIRDLRLDNPRLSFSLELPNEELAQLRAMEDPILVWRVAPTSRPSDTREQRWIEAMPEMMDGAPVQRWAAQPATAEEMAAWDAANQPPPPAPPPPDWDRFQSQLQTSNGFPDAWSAIFTGDARPGISLIASLAVWQATGQWTQFLVAIGACLALLPAEQAAHVGLELLALAADCNLDPAFCEALEAMLEVG